MLIINEILLYFYNKKYIIFIIFIFKYIIFNITIMNKIFLHILLDAVALSCSTQWTEPCAIGAG